MLPTGLRSLFSFGGLWKTELFILVFERPWRWSFTQLSPKVPESGLQGFCRRQRKWVISELLTHFSLIWFSFVSQTDIQLLRWDDFFFTSLSFQCSFHKGEQTVCCRTKCKRKNLLERAFRTVNLWSTFLTAAFSKPHQVERRNLFLSKYRTLSLKMKLIFNYRIERNFKELWKSRRNRRETTYDDFLHIF